MRTIVMCLTALMLLACSNNNDKEAVGNAVDNFADNLFNFRYTTAAESVTPDSRRILEFLASNMDANALESIRNVTDTPTIVIKSIEVKNDTVAKAKVSVTGEIMIDTIGHLPTVCKDERVYTFELNKRGRQWLVKMADLPRSEK